MSTANVSLGSLNAYAAGDDARAQNIFFDENSTSPTSQVFQVNLEPYYIQAFNLVTGDEVTVEVVMGNGSGTLFTPFAPVFGAIKLTSDRTKVRIDWPGRYRLHYTAGGHLGQFHAVGYYGTMTQESTMDLAEALRTVITTGKTYLNGTDPILVTGLGTLADPYVISANQANNLQEENGVPAQYLINAGTLKHIVNATTANQDVRVGVGAGNNNLREICIGYLAGLNSTGINSIGIGNLVLELASGEQNIAIGTQACSLASGGGNIGIGITAGNGTKSSFVTCLGRNSLFVETGNDYSIAVGDFSGTGTGLGYGNSCIYIGNKAGNTSIISRDLSNSILIGNRSTAPAFNGGLNTIGIGEGAGYSSSYDHNVAIGTFAGGPLGQSSIAIGRYAGVYSSTGGIRIGPSKIDSANDAFSRAIMIGTHCGDGSTGEDLIAMGRETARYQTMPDVVAIGRNAYSNVPVGAVAITPTFTQADITVGGAGTPGSVNIPGHGLTIGTDVVVYVNLVSGFERPNAAQALVTTVGDVWTVHIVDANNVSLGVAGPSAGSFVNIGSGTFQLYDLTGVTYDYENVICIGAETQPTMDNQAVIGNASVTQLVTAGSVISGGTIVPSDQRLKTHITDYQNGLDFIQKVRPVTFSWNELALKQGNIPHLRTDLPKTQYGVIADEFEKLMPDMVENVNHGFGDYKFVRYERTIPILYSAIKELASQVKELSSEVAKCKKSSSKVQEKDNG